MKSTKPQHKSPIASSRSGPPSRALAAGKGKGSRQPAASSKPPKGASSHKFFNGLYAFLTIMGMVVSALGLRSRVNQARVIPAGQVQTSPAVIDWIRDGGPAGKCQEVQIWSDGQANLGGCIPSKTDQTIRFDLSKEEVIQLRNWLGQFQSFSIDLKPSALPPNDQIHLAFRGLGSQPATILDKQAIESYVENLIQTGG